jgi:uncharacterized membrane protein YfcA
MTLFLILLCSFLAFGISAICGGGAGLMLIPLLSGMLPVSQVPAALSIGTFSSSASRLIAFKKNICWHIVKYFVPAALPAVWLGAWLLKFLNPLYLQLAMGIFLISNLPFALQKNRTIVQGPRPSNIALAIIGFAAGFLSGITGAVGLIFNKFYLRYGLTKEEIVATRAANEIILHLIKIILYIFFGLITNKVIIIGVLVALAAVLSTVAMKYILPKISELLFKKIGYFAMVASGIIMLSQSGTDLFAANNGRLTTSLIANGVEAKLKWQDARFALEFAYDEGFEFEQVIPIHELTDEQQQYVLTQKGNADKVVIESVHTFRNKTYEAYYFTNNELVKKIEFD